MKALKLAIIIGISICLVVLGIYYIGYKRFYAQHSIPFYRFKIIKKYPHNQDYFTEGLVIHNDKLYESSGGYANSKIVVLNLAQNKILREYKLPKQYFGEGITILNNKLYQLTYKSNTGFVYNLPDFKLLQTFRYPSQGWGLTTDGKYLIMSDGSSALHFLDPKTFQQVKVIYVTAKHKNIGYLNELEYINGKIYANVWQSNLIAIIVPDTGKVVAWIDLAEFPHDANGIAYDGQTIYITGKHWPFVGAGSPRSKG